MPRLFLSAGDPSGDFLASLLVRQIKESDPSVEVWAVGGPELRRCSDVFVADLASKGMIGWLEPLRRLPGLLALLRRLDRILANEKFDAVVPVDFYGFNIRLARLAKKRGRRVFYFVSPQVWASRPSRLKAIKRWVDHMLCLFPFETEFYRKAGIAATFVGHPLLEVLEPASALSLRANGGMRPSSPHVGLLPGSRPGEIRRHMGVLLEVWTHLRAAIPGIQGILFKRPEWVRAYPDESRLLSLGIRSVFGASYDERKKLDLALTASGLASLENMLMGLPMVIFYSIQPAWLYAIVKRIVRTRFMGMPNILAGRMLAPESTWAATRSRNRRAAHTLAALALGLLRDPAQRRLQREEFHNLRRILYPGGGESPKHAAARRLLELCKKDSV